MSKKLAYPLATWLIFWALWSALSFEAYGAKETLDANQLISKTEHLLETGQLSRAKAALRTAKDLSTWTPSQMAQWHTLQIWYQLRNEGLQALPYIGLKAWPNLLTTPEIGKASCGPEEESLRKLLAEQKQLLSQPEIASTYAKMLRERGAYAAALQVLNTALKAQEQPNKPKHLLLVADIQIALGRHQEADSQIRTALALIEESKKNTDGAQAESWKSALVQAKTLLWVNQYRQGQISLCQNQIDGLLEEIKKLTGQRKCPEIITLTFYKGQLAAWRNDYRMARKRTIDAYDLAGSRSKNYDIADARYANLLYYRCLYAFESDDQHKAMKYLSQYSRNIRRYHPGQSDFAMMLTHLKTYDQTTSARNDLALEVMSKGLRQAWALPLQAGDIGQERAQDYLYQTAIDFDSLRVAEQIIAQKKAAYESPLTLGTQSPKTRIAQMQYAWFMMKTSSQVKQSLRVFQENWPYITESFHIEHPNYPKWMLWYAEVLQANDQIDKALALAMRTDSLYRVRYGVKSVENGACLSFVSQLYLDKGDYEKAVIFANKAVETIRQTGYKRSIEYVQALRTRGRINTLISNYDQAEEDIEEAIGIKSVLVGQNDISATSAFDDLALLLYLQGRYNQAISYLDAVISDRSSRYGRTWHLIPPMLLKAQIAVANGDFTQADQIITDASRIARNSYADTSLVVLNCDRARAQVYLQIGDFERAKLALDKSATQFAKVLGTKHPETINAQLQAAIAGYLLSQDAGLWYEKFADITAMAKAVVGDQHPLYASCLENVATLAMALNRNDEAANQLATAAAIYNTRFGKRNVRGADVMLIEADLAFKRKQIAAAEIGYQNAQRIYRRVLSKTHPKYVLAEARLARIAAAKKDLKKAVQLMGNTVSTYLAYLTLHFPFLSEREKALYWGQMRPDFELYRYLLVSAQEPDAAVKLFDDALTTKGLLMSNNRQLRSRMMAVSDSTIRKNFTLWLGAREELTAMQARGEPDFVIASKEDDIQKAEKIMAEKSSVFNQYYKNRGITLSDIRQTLKTGEAAVEMLRIEVHEPQIVDTVLYAALVLTPTSRTPQLVTLPKGKDLDEKGLAYYRNAVKYNYPDSKSYNRYWKPLASNLTGVRNLYFAPDGVYYLLNLEALPLAETKGIVGDQINIITLNSSRDIVKAVPQFANQNMYALLMGDPAFYPTGRKPTTAAIDDLPGAGREVRSLDSLLRASKVATTTLLSTQATEEKIKAIKSPTVLHLATHGYFADEDDLEEGANALSAMAAYQAMNSSLMRSGLLFSNAGEILRDSTINNPNHSEGVLTAYEAQVLNLENTRLVVLSACETGLGKVQSGEGVFGMQRAMQLAGAQAIIMSLFKANDEVTQLLMQKLYQNYLRTGNLKESFVQARNTIRQQHPDPSSWAGFVMVGR